MFPASRVFLAVSVLLLLRPVTSWPVSKDVNLLMNKRIVNGNDADPGSHPYITTQQRNLLKLWLTDVDMIREWYGEVCAAYKQDCTRFNNVTDDYLRDYVQTEHNYFDYWDHNCGGSLIGDVWVLTAAHCVQMYQEKHFPALRIVLGEHHLSENSTIEEERGVEVIIVHSEYNKPFKYSNDIALIKLSSPVTPCEHIKFATLPENDTEFINSECIFAGWGDNSPNTSPKVLQEIHMDYIPFDECWIKLNKRKDLDSKRQLCAVDKTPDSVEGSGDTCSGDSGGPMMCGEDHSILTGVTSIGYSEVCRGTEKPGVYTRVSAYTCWIKQHTGIGI